MRSLLIVLPILVLGASCTTARPVVVAPKTSLENDLLGGFAWQQPGPRLIVPRSAASQPSTQQQLIDLLLRRHARRAEIGRLVAEKLAREGDAGLIVLDVDAIRQAAEQLPVLKRLVQAENADRGELTRLLRAKVPRLAGLPQQEVQRQVARMVPTREQPTGP